MKTYITRHSLERCYADSRNCTADMVPDPDGPYVLLDDVIRAVENGTLSEILAREAWLTQQDMMASPSE